MINNKKMSNGITLIALVVSIIVKNGDWKMGTEK